MVDKPGVLNRVASLMRARNFNIDSLAVSRTDRAGLSRMTISLHGDDVAVEQAAKQLYRLIDVLKVQDVTAEPTVEHELALVKVRVTDVESRRRAQARRADPRPRAGRRAGCGHRGGRAAARPRSTPSWRASAAFGIKELVRTGAVVMARGSGSIEEAIKR